MKRISGESNCPRIGDHGRIAPRRPNPLDASTGGAHNQAHSGAAKRAIGQRPLKMEGYQAFPPPRRATPNAMDVRHGGNRRIGGTIRILPTLRPLRWRVRRVRARNPRSPRIGRPAANPMIRPAEVGTGGFPCLHASSGLRNAAGGNQPPAARRIGPLDASPPNEARPNSDSSILEWERADWRESPRATGIG